MPRFPVPGADRGRRLIGFVTVTLIYVNRTRSLRCWSVVHHWSACRHHQLVRIASQRLMAGSCALSARVSEPREASSRRACPSRGRCLAVLAYLASASTIAANSIRLIRERKSRLTSCAFAGSWQRSANFCRRPSPRTGLSSLDVPPRRRFAKPQIGTDGRVNCRWLHSHDLNLPSQVSSAITRAAASLQVAPRQPWARNGHATRLKRLKLLAARFNVPHRKP